MEVNIKVIVHKLSAERVVCHFEVQHFAVWQRYAVQTSLPAIIF